MHTLARFRWDPVGEMLVTEASQKVPVGSSLENVGLYALPGSLPESGEGKADFVVINRDAPSTGRLRRVPWATGDIAETGLLSVGKRRLLSRRIRIHILAPITSEDEFRNDLARVLSNAYGKRVAETK